PRRPAMAAARLRVWKCVARIAMRVNAGNTVPIFPGTSKDGSDGTRTRDLRRDRPGRAPPLQPAATVCRWREQAFLPMANRLRPGASGCHPAELVWHMCGRLGVNSDNAPAARHGADGVSSAHAMQVVDRRTV